MRSSGVGATERYGERLSKQLVRARRGQEHARVIALVGELGSGKTAFVRGFTRGLGIRRRVTSPTFVLARRYRIPAAAQAQSAKRKARTEKRFALRALRFAWLWHFDCYRLRSEHDLAELGFHEILKDPHAIAVIEWADRIRRALPRGAIWITFRHRSRNTREIAFKGGQRN